MIREGHKGHEREEITINVPLIVAIAKESHPREKTERRGIKQHEVKFDLNVIYEKVVMNKKNSFFRNPLNVIKFFEDNVDPLLQEPKVDGKIFKKLVIVKKILEFVYEVRQEEESKEENVTFMAGLVKEKIKEVDKLLVKYP